MPYEFHVPLRYKVGFAICGILAISVPLAAIGFFTFLVIRGAEYNAKKEKEYNEAHGIIEDEEWEDVLITEDTETLNGAPLSEAQKRFIKFRIYIEKKVKEYNEAHGIKDEESEGLLAAEDQWADEELRRNLEKWK